jgi:O-antigen ligase
LPALLLYVAGAFLLPKGNASAVLFYVAVLPCLVARLNCAPFVQWREPGVGLALGLIAFSGLTLIWGEGGAHRLGQFAADTIATLGFVLALLLTLDAPHARNWFARALIWAGAVNAAVAIARGLLLPPHDPLDPRLWGWGVAEHPILGAMVMTTAYLTAFSRGLARPAAWWNFAAAAVMLIFIGWCESRGPLVAAFAATLFLLSRHVRRWWPAAIVAALAAAADLANTPAGAHVWSVLARRGFSHRWEIWRATLGAIGQRLWFGHGLGGQMHLPVGGQDITFPHDLYLSLLYYSGVVGLALFVALMGVLALRLWRERDAETPWLAAMGVATLVGGLTDLGQVTKGPGPMWFILWVPVGLVLTHGRKEGFFFEKKNQKTFAGAVAGSPASPRQPS